MNCENCPLMMKGCEIVYVNGEPKCPAQTDGTAISYSTATEASNVN